MTPRAATQSATATLRKLPPPFFSLHSDAPWWALCLWLTAGAACLCLRGWRSFSAQDLLIKRFEGHWYPEEPHRGCAYRALISTVSCVDPLLMRAAEVTGQRGLCESFMRVFSDVGEVNCWVRAAAACRPSAIRDAPPTHTPRFNA